MTGEIEILAFRFKTQADAILFAGKLRQIFPSSASANSAFDLFNENNGKIYIIARNRSIQLCQHRRSEKEATSTT